MPSSFCASTANSIGNSANFLAKPIDDHPHGIFGRETALVAVKDLVLANLRRRGLVFDLTVGIAHLDVGERVSAAPIANQHGITLGKIARVLRVLS